MTDVGPVEFAAGGRVQEQSTATGYRKAWQCTLGWAEAAAGSGQRGASAGFGPARGPQSPALCSSPPAKLPAGAGHTVGA